MMTDPAYFYSPLYQVTRGETVESIHYGAIAVVNAQGELIASSGNPAAVTFLRSTAKPFQALPFVEKGGAEHFNLTPEEIALICASHSGTDTHVKTLTGLQKKIGLSEHQLLCGTHLPYHKPTARLLRDRGERPTPNRHNCSGKHTGMLAHARLLNAPLDSYIDPAHPVQQSILETLAAMCGLAPGEIQVGTDGCSVPCFAMPMRNAAWGWARMVDPDGLPPDRARACRKITRAMRAHPFMVAGPSRLDTVLMDTAHGKVTAKAGAEAYQGLGVTLPDAQPLGIAIKIADGDGRKRAMGPVVLETLKQLNVLEEEELQSLTEFGPVNEIRNHRDLLVGLGQPCFSLTFHQA
jgi:L-asparaginase II